MKSGIFTQYELMLLLGLSIMVVFLLIIVTFSWIHQKKKGKEESRQFTAQSEYQARLNEMRIQHEEKERLRFSNELQKETSKLKSALREMNYAMQNVDLTSWPEIREKFSGSLEEIESISRKIAPSILSESGLTQALQSLVNQLAQNSRADLFFAEKGYKKQDEMTEIALFRIAEEIISNALKHGKPNRIDVSLTGTNQQVVLEIRDNGFPFDLKKKLSENQINAPGNGLKNMASRLQHHAELVYTHTEGANRNKIVYSI